MNLSWLMVALVSTIVWAGFVLHTSSGDGLLLGKYSGSYAGLLVFLTVVWLGLNSWTWRQGRALSARLRGFSVSIGITLLLAALILPGTYIYLHQRSLERDVFGPMKPDAHSFFQMDLTPNPPAELPDALRVLALGGSTTWSTALERSQAYPAVLQRLLAQAWPGRRVEVMNAGVPWQNSFHSLLRYVGRFSEWKPHVVIVMHAFNDIFQASEGRLTSGAFRTDYGHFFGALGNRVNPTDRLANMLGNALSNNWLARTWYSDLSGPVETPALKTVDLMKPLPSFRRNLTRIIHRVRQDGAQIILATQPYLYRENMPEEERKNLFYDYYYKDYAVVPSIAEQQSAMDAFNAAVRGIARGSNVTLVDLERAVPKSPEWMYDDVHYTVAGAQKVAEEFVAQVPWGQVIAARFGEAR